MNKAVLISIKPKWCELIASGRKTIEVRKSRPKLKTPFKCYIYQTNLKRGTGKVVGEFICDEIDKIRVFENGTVQFWMLNNLHNSCIEYDELADYIGWGKQGYGWHISDLKIYDTPKKLNEFRSWQPSVEWIDGYPMPTHKIKRAFQSWGYVCEID